jgi:hypothetical protein
MTACPRGDLRDVYFGLLGPDARSVSYRGSNGALVTEPTVGADGAYLIVLPDAGGIGGESGGPTLGAGTTTPIRLVRYSHGACNLAAQAASELRNTAAWRRALYARFPALAKAIKNAGAGLHGGVIGLSRPISEHNRKIILAIVKSPAYHSFVRRHRNLIPARLLPPTCPAVGYVAPKTRLVTSSEVATPISARVESAHHYCVNATEIARPCNTVIPPGYHRTRPSGHDYLLLVVTWRARVPVTSQAAHYEVYHGNAGAGIKSCGGGTSFGPVETDLHAGQEVVFTDWLPRACPGALTGRVDYVQDTGPAGSIPVPAQPGEGPDIPVGTFHVNVP